VESALTPKRVRCSTDPMPEPDEQLGYRGPTACAAAGQHLFAARSWARTDFGVVRRAVGNGQGRSGSIVVRHLVLKGFKRLLDPASRLKNIRRAVGGSTHCVRAGGDDLAGSPVIRRHTVVRVHRRRIVASAGGGSGRLRYRSPAVQLRAN